ncbi:MAG: Asp-tRNA(Asn)/Glu-tRNA(Gln) amidotransferase subunit GatC [Dehalococcoidales bacterium]|jgi:aspartyl-tRNA(Asn)/glutamyl-tRNA(Gln) amidotransferase subunit C|nr:Asp-tRNA(Asn)/Glu-tRNA(Gln) amidotransferase subunit GatC [Dehalococcoidales bacterium]
MKLSREEVLHITRLARVSLTEAEVDKLNEQLSNILEHFDVLQQIDTTNVPSTAQSIEFLNVLKNDITDASLPQSQVLANAPRKESNFFRVRTVLK